MKHKLNNTDKLLLTTLSNLSENGELITTQIELAKILNCNRITINRKIQKLRTMGVLDYIVLVGDDGMSKQTKIYNINNPMG